MTTRLVILIERTNKKWPGFRVLLVASRGTCNEHHSHRHHRRPSMKPRRTLMAVEAAMVWRYDEDVLNEIRCAAKTTRLLDVPGLLWSTDISRQAQSSRKFWPVDWTSKINKKTSGELFFFSSVGKMIFVSRQNLALKWAYVLCVCLIVVEAFEQQHYNASTYSQSSRRNQSPLDQTKASNQSSANQQVRTSQQQEARNAKLTRTPSASLQASKQNQTISKRSQVGRSMGNNYDNDNHNPAHSQQQAAQGDTRVPFWNIAHMINSIEQVDIALRWVWRQHKHSMRFLHWAI